uniref:CRAL-TRIO domain-containing protein n=1 Tax=Rhabditophanes sp. KR3021 TaxID=114890 RepID=A0AC35TQ94_9BILA
MNTLRRNKPSNNKSNRHSSYYGPSSGALIQICFEQVRDSLLHKNMGSLHFDLLTSVFSHILNCLQDPLLSNILVLIDARKLTQKYVRLLLKTIKITFGNKISQVLLIEPEGFIIQQKINFDILMDAYDYKTNLVTLNKVHKYVNGKDLVDPFGPYGLSTWIDITKSFEEYLDQKKCSKFVDKHYILGGITKLRKKDKSILVEMILNEGELRRRGDQRKMASIMNINYQKKKAVDEAVEDGEEIEELRNAIEENDDSDSPKLIPSLLREHCEGMAQLVEWVRGAGLTWFGSLNEMGSSVDEVKQLDKELRQLVSKTEEVAEQARELCEGVEFFIETRPEFGSELIGMRQNMEMFVVEFVNKIKRHFATVQQSLTFHESLSEFYRQSDILLKILCTEGDEMAKEVNTLRQDIHSLESSFIEMTRAFETMNAHADNFLQNLKNIALTDGDGKRKAMTEHYNINELIKNARDSRLKRKELVEIRSLRLQQMVQLKACESDIELVLTWIKEICTFNSFSPKMRDPILSIYAYGKQLSQVGMLIRRSLRLQCGPLLVLTSELDVLYKGLQSTLNL